jgi:hypothetical protein
VSISLGHFSPSPWRFSEAAVAAGGPLRLSDAAGVSEAVRDLGLRAPRIAAAWSWRSADGG